MSGRQYYTQDMLQCILDYYRWLLIVAIQEEEDKVNECDG